MPANHTDLEKRLWDAADELRANSKLKSSEYSVPVLGLIFLRYADHKFAEAEKKMPPQTTNPLSGFGMERSESGRKVGQFETSLWPHEIPPRHQWLGLMMPHGTCLSRQATVSPDLRISHA